MIKMPMGEYTDFEDCVSKNKDKDNPEAYCGEIKKKTEQSSKRVMFNLVRTGLKNQKDSENGLVITGVALSEGEHNDVFYPSFELNKSYPSLMGKKLMLDHSKSARDVIGLVDQARFDEYEKCIMFQAIVKDQEIQDKIKLGLLDSVSVGVYCDIDTDKDGTIMARNLEFAELSIVAFPADDNALFKEQTRNFLLNYKKEKGEAMVNEKLADKPEPPVPVAPTQPPEGTPPQPGAPPMDEKDTLIKQLYDQIAALTAQLQEALTAAQTAQATVDQATGAQAEMSKKMAEMQKLITDRKSTLSTVKVEEDKVFELSVKNGEITPKNYDPYMGTKRR